MKYLLDTHALIWALFDPSKLSRTVKELIPDPQNDIYVSVVSLWEVSLKYSIQRLALEGIKPDELPLVLIQAGFQLLPLDAEPASSFYRLPREANRDPFDRMLVWQAIILGVPLVSKDDALDVYAEQGLKRSW